MVNATSAGPSEEELWDTYAATTLLAELSRGEPALLAGAGAVPWPGDLLGDRAWVLTAANPMSRLLSEEANAARNAALDAALDAAGVHTWPALGRGEGWAEPSRLVLADAEVVLELARAYQQKAVFRLDAGWVEVLDCEDGRVRRSTPRVR